MYKKDKPRLTRLTAILTQLQSKKILTAREIAEKYDVSIRTIYRDIRTLESSGVPIITEEGKGYSLLSSFNLPPVMFSENEANALITAEHLVLKNNDDSFTENYKSAIIKIKSVLQFQQKGKVDLLSQRIEFRNNDKEQKTSKHLMTIQSAITDYSLIYLEYSSLQNKFSTRTVEPFAIYCTQNNWLLIAFCRLRNEFRAFRLDMIMKLHVKDEHFEPHKMTLQEYFEECKRKYNTLDTPLS